MSVKKMHILACLVAGTSIVGTSQAAPVVVLSNDFTNATRVGAPPTALDPTLIVTGVDADSGTTNRWVAAVSNNTAMAVSIQAADLATNVGTGINGNSLFVTNSGAPYSLTTTFAQQSLVAIGDKLTLTLNIRTPTTGTLPVPAFNTGAGVFQVGLFSTPTTTILGANTNSFSGATYVSPTTINTGTVFNDDAGYIGRYSTSTTTVTSEVRDRSGGTGVTLFAGTFTTVAGTSVASQSTIAVDTTYAVLLELERTATGVRITSSFNGSSVDVTDTTTPNLNFNQIGVFFGSAFGLAASRANFVDDVVVTFTPIPEPTTLAAVAGALVLGLRRRRA